MNYREAILQGVSEASQISSRFRPTGGRTSFDVVGTIIDLNIPLMFRPLKTLLGATIEIGNGVRGIMATSRRDLHLQRFTLAHELGHFVMNHETHIDLECDIKGKYQESTAPYDELSANTFASEILASRDLMVNIARAQKWNSDLLHSPGIVYQLSLRLGISYQAACWALVSQGILKRQEVEPLLSVVPKAIKHEMLSKDISLSDSWANVWSISLNDSGAHLECGPNDIFIFKLKGNASTGHIWDFSEFNGIILSDETLSLSNRIGSEEERIITAQFPLPQLYQVRIPYHRPWLDKTEETLELTIDAYGRESEGLARREQENLLAEAA